MAVSPHRTRLCKTGDDTSPFSMLKPGARADHGYILRTRSLELDSPGKLDAMDENSQSEEQSSAMALHSSFDAAYTRGVCGSPSFDSEDKSDFRTSWDETDPGSPCDLSGKKHLLQLAGTEILEANPPRTIRKVARRTGNELSSKTPARPRLRPPGSAKKPCSTTTPTSAMKRRRAPLPQRQSPMRRVPLTSPPSHRQGLSSTPATEQSSSIFSSGLNGISFVQSPPALTPTRQGGTHGSTMKSMSKWHNTGTTTAATTVLETTLQSDTSSPTTRFRFTSFPASLPRVNNPRNRQCPDSVRKRMNFAETSVHSDANQSRDDDGTQNTSISSLSGEGGHHHHLPLHPGTHPPSILELGAEGVDRPVHGQLFPDEDFGYSDDDSTDSPGRGLVGRTGTRLNFNMVMSPKRYHDEGKRASVTGGNTLMPLDLNMELSRPYDQRRINSFPSSLSSTSHINDLGGAFTPARSGEKQEPWTPREVQVHFPLEAECSPIPGIRDDHCTDLHPDSNSEASSGLVGNELLSRPNHSGYVDSMMPLKDSSKLKADGSVASESTSAKARRLRPMPDMSAFENAAGSSRGDRSDDSATLDSQGIQSTHRLLCPPTPVRTPAWANESGPHGFLGARQNSLITTKVLLSCPSQVVQGRCSLESSVLDDDSKASGGRVFREGPALREKRRGDSRAGDMAESGSADESVTVNVAGTIGNGTNHAAKTPKIPAPPRLMRRIPSSQEVVSFSNDFEILNVLGSGTFADVYKVKSTRDDRLYAVKRNRRQFRGKRDRDMALAEVQSMQRLQKVCAESNMPLSSEKNSYCLYLLFFYRAWQEDGYFYCQTELCCRDTCRELLDSLRFLWNSAKNKYPSLLRNLPAPEGIHPGSDLDISGRLTPNMTVWKICQDIAAGLSHIHSHGIVHHDIKPSNIMFVANARFGAMCKIGDFGMAGDTGSTGDGQEGDTRYMPPELLSSGARHPCSDIFSLGLTLYEIATDQNVEMPAEGLRWHELRSANGPKLPDCRDQELVQLIQQMTNPCEKKRPTADTILKNEKVNSAGHGYDSFLADYIKDIEEFDRIENERLARDHHEDQTPRNGSHRSTMAPVRSPSLSMLMPAAPSLLSPLAHQLH